jgi:hypothetical protein
MNGLKIFAGILVGLLAGSCSYGIRYKGVMLDQGVNPSDAGVISLVLALVALACALYVIWALYESLRGPKN